MSRANGVERLAAHGEGERSGLTFHFNHPSLAVLALTLLLFASSAFAQGRFVPAGALQVARTAHTATLLNDGRVLIVGGRGGDGVTPLASVELYEPKSNRFKAAASLHTARANHVATLLADGRVLVTGGARHDGSAFLALASAEFYEPKTDKWVDAPEMLEARQGHSATLRADGTVFIAGGAREKAGALATTEVFDGKHFTAGPALTSARMAHSALSLDGGVLLVAGRALTATGSGSLALAKADLCAAACTELDGLAEARQRHASVLTSKGVFVIGGVTATGMTNYVEQLAPGAPKFELASTHLPRALAGHTATALPKADVLVIGGETPNAVDVPRAMLLKAGASSWCEAGTLAVGRKGHSATLLKSGEVLVVGGTSSGIPETSAELWKETKGECAAP